ncbi:hypothetical protein Pmani_006602 [Petrolisthes manimaculis]|uniref:Uncharacterized protein n=1 Tax=Petrolisthes manimaculis TaxID=1843537 RepID=A0AAE1UKX4_9EUCA|nr:hypothetical protein Pmani_006602 [Petrolisthes manimaculis]
MNLLSVQQTHHAAPYNLQPNQSTPVCLSPPSYLSNYNDTRSYVSRSPPPPNTTAGNSTSKPTEFVNCCRAYEATKMTPSAIHAMPSKLKAVSTYKKNQRREKKAYSQQTYKENTPLTNACQSCRHQHH